MVRYVIYSGRSEKGNEEQKPAYRMLFCQEDTQYFFDPYFHWYNLVQETGHCLVEKQAARFSKVEEEMYVNYLAVSYYRYIGEDLISFYTRIWNIEQIKNVMIYGYVQSRSVLEALNDDMPLTDVMENE